MPVGLNVNNSTDDRRESLLSILKDISPNVDNYFVTNLGTGAKATNTVHAWPVYHTERPTSVTNRAEGFTASYGDLSAPEQSVNYLALLAEEVRVSHTRRAVASITGEDPLTFQKREALKRLKAQMEWLTINGGGLTSATSGVAAQMAGFDNVISTNVTARNSNTSFTLSEVDDIVEDSYNAVGSEYVGDTLLVPMVLKRRIATYHDTNTRVVDLADKKIGTEIRAYDSAVGYAVNILPHKDVRSAAGSVTAYLLREDLYQHSFLMEPEYHETGKDGSRDNGFYETQFTVVSYAQKASAKRTGYSASL
jgi:hypothetical protein